MPDLKACPFCGPLSKPHVWYSGEGWNVKCLACGIHCVFRTREKAVRWWNTRDPLVQEMQEWIAIGCQDRPSDSEPVWIVQQIPEDYSLPRLGSGKRFVYAARYKEAGDSFVYADDDEKVPRVEVTHWRHREMQPSLPALKTAE